jgi:mRNA interferase HigB
MEVIDAHIIEKFARRHADARTALDEWKQIVAQADWQTPQAVKNHWPKASILSGNRIVFNIKGNDYRLLTVIDYVQSAITILKIGTHQEYDKWKLEN